MRVLLAMMVLAGSAVAEPQAKADAKSDAKADAKSDAKADAKSAAKADKADAKPDKADAKPPKPDKADAKPPKPDKADPKSNAADEPKDGLLALTDDPVFGKADKIDGNEVKGMVTFTFDDGPNPETTPAVIDALEKYDVPGTFFVVTQRLLGKHGEKPREILKRLVEGGFAIGSHSVTHPNLRLASKDKLAKEIDGSIRTLSPAANQPIGLFRFPFGASNKLARARLAKLGLTEAFWSIDTLDWQAKSPDKLRKKVFQMIVKQEGGVVLMHDVKPITAKVIADVLDDLEIENCQRLANKQEPILPVSIHYYLKDGKTPRAVPDAVKTRTETYRASLPKRCAKRPSPPAAAPPTTPIQTPAKPAIPAKP
ncbi:MAG: polysaccharide deacetylase family protein [Kofleriaceae bacterium]